MSATAEITIAQLDRAEYDLIDALAGLPADKRAMRARALEVLEKLRTTKRALLARSPDILHKAGRSAPAEPSWRGLPVDNIAAKTMVTETRDRQLEERRLAKSGHAAASREVALGSLKKALRQPSYGNAGMIEFLTRRAGR